MLKYKLDSKTTYNSTAFSVGNHGLSKMKVYFIASDRATGVAKKMIGWT